MIATIEKQMCAIPQGNITLNDDRIQQKWNVEIAPFLLAAYPVTQALYAALCPQKQSGSMPVKLAHQAFDTAS